MGRYFLAILLAKRMLRGDIQTLYALYIAGVMEEK